MVITAFGDSSPTRPRFVGTHSEVEKRQWWASRCMLSYFLHSVPSSGYTLGKRDGSDCAEKGSGIASPGLEPPALVVLGTGMAHPDGLPPWGQGASHL